MATEEPVVAIETAVVSAAAEPESVEEQPAAKAKKVKKAAGTKKPRSYPSYVEMISDAIVTLKEKNGSSQYAIAKFSEEKHKQLPANFKKLLLSHLKKLVVSGKLVKVKGSFKLPSAAPKAIASAPKKLAVKAPVKTKAVAPKSAPKAKAVTKRKAVSSVAKPKAAAKPKAVAKPKLKLKEKTAKAARTSTRTSPGKKAAAAKPVVKKTAVKSVKPKTMKSPAKKVATRKGKK